MGRTGSNGGDGFEGAKFKELRVLEEVDSTPDVSQRKLAAEVGIALGVVNVLVKTMIAKGYVRATRLGWRHWKYILTPAGVARKVQLTANYVDGFLGHYRRVRSMVHETLIAAPIGPESTVGIYGTTELGEFMFLVLRRFGVKRVVFFDESGPGEFLGVPVRRLDNIDPEEYAMILVAFANEIEPRKETLINAGACADTISTLLDLQIAGQACNRPGATSTW